MKKLLLVIAVFQTLTAKSQTSVYHSFPEDTATWVSDQYDAICMGYCGSNYFEMRGDTIINSQSYNKIYFRGGGFYYISPPPNLVIGAGFSPCSFIGGVRQDSINKKVYFIDYTMTTDTLLYDFNISIGDSVYSWYNRYNSIWPTVVTSIDSVLINNSYYKVFNFDNSSTYTGNCLIEGVGWAGDLFTVKPGVDPLSLACFNGNNIVGLAFDPAILSECSFPLDCSISLSINEQSEINNFYIFPNPFSDELNFSINNNELSEIIIYDITSRKLLQQKFTNSVSINTQQLTKGIYLYEVRCGSSLCKKGKLVKN